MEKLLMELEKYRKENVYLEKNEFATLQKFADELHVILKHSSEKVTLEKHELATYLSLLGRYKEVEGFNMATNFIAAYIKEQL